MAITVTCPNGHALKVKDELAGKTGLCPHCKAKVHVPLPGQCVSDDDIMAMLGPSAPSSGGDAHDPPAPSESAPSKYAVAGDGMEEAGIMKVGSSALQRKKVCPQCGGQTSVAFAHCPRCGTPLPSARKPSAK
jgi:hypothetical protein